MPILKYLPGDFYFGGKKTNCAVIIFLTTHDGILPLHYDCIIFIGDKMAIITHSKSQTLDVWNEIKGMISKEDYKSYMQEIKESEMSEEVSHSLINILEDDAAGNLKNDIFKIISESPKIFEMNFFNN